MRMDVVCSHREILLRINRLSRGFVGVTGSTGRINDAMMVCFGSVVLFEEQ